MTPEEYNTKREDVLSKFDASFIEKYLLNDDTFHKVYNLLIRNDNPYYIIQLLIEQRKEIVDKIEELANQLPPRSIILTKEEYDSFKSKK